MLDGQCRDIVRDASRSSYIVKVCRYYRQQFWGRTKPSKQYTVSKGHHLREEADNKG